MGKIGNKEQMCSINIYQLFLPIATLRHVLCCGQMLDFLEFNAVIECNIETFKIVLEIEGIYLCNEQLSIRQ